MAFSCREVPLSGPLLLCTLASCMSPCTTGESLLQGPQSKTPKYWTPVPGFNRKGSSCVKGWVVVDLWFVMCVYICCEQPSKSIHVCLFCMGLSLALSSAWCFADLHVWVFSKYLRNQQFLHNETLAWRFDCKVQMPLTAASAASKRVWKVT